MDAEYRPNPAGRRCYLIDENFCKRQLLPFEDALKVGQGKRRTFNSGKFNAKAYSRCSAEGVFDRKEIVSGGKPKIALKIDCSGSMSGIPIHGAAHMAHILSILHNSGAIEARVFCSGASGGSRNGFEVPMPQPQVVWERLKASHGSEYLSQTFYKFRERIMECDILACYTDADISDRRLRPQLWRRHGKSCIGLYQGPAEQVDVMAKYFDYSIARSSLSDLFTEFLRIIRRVLV